MKDVYQKWKVELIFEAPETVRWLGLTDPDPHTLHCYSVWLPNNGQLDQQRQNRMSCHATDPIAVLAKSSSLLPAALPFTIGNCARD